MTSSLLYIDDDLLAADKSEGLATIPERGAQTDCLLARLQDELAQKLFVVHRLDKEVSGIVLFARHAAAHRRLNMAFERREIEKHYRALVFGTLHRKEGRMDQPLREFGSGRMGVDAQAGKSSLTAYQVLKEGNGYSLVDVYPITGRRHQIRVHLYAMGHAIVGDRRYGDRRVQGNHPRLMLHAERITFGLFSGEIITLSSPLPSSFTAVLQQLGGNDLL